MTQKSTEVYNISSDGFPMISLWFSLVLEILPQYFHHPPRIWCPPLACFINTHELYPHWLGYMHVAWCVSGCFHRRAHLHVTGRQLSWYMVRAWHCTVVHARIFAQFLLLFNISWFCYLSGCSTCRSLHVNVKRFTRTQLYSSAYLHGAYM